MPHLAEEPFTDHHGRWIDARRECRAETPAEAAPPAAGRLQPARDDRAGRPQRARRALFSFVAPEDAKPWVDMYYQLLGSDERVPAGLAVNPNFAVVAPSMCHPDEETAIERASTAPTSSAIPSLITTPLGGTAPPEPACGTSSSATDTALLCSRIDQADQQPLEIKVLQGAVGSLRGAVGTPDQIAELCARYEAAGVDQVIFVAEAGLNCHEHVCEALDLSGKQVLPRFADDREAKETAKRDRIAEAVERAMARRPVRRSVTWTTT